MYYSYNTQVPVHSLPHRIRLADGSTRTNNTTYTEDEIISAGYAIITQEKPVPSRFQKVEWTGIEWVLLEMTDTEKQEVLDMQWKSIRIIRDQVIQELDWRIQRYLSEVRLDLPLTDDIRLIDTYVQELRDITKQEDPFNIVWPYMESSTTAVNPVVEPN
jgi:hypothetical protein